MSKLPFKISVKKIKKGLDKQYSVQITNISPETIVEKKYYAGKKYISFFRTNGVVISENSFEVRSAGVYTVYVKTDKSEYIKPIRIGNKKVLIIGFIGLILVAGAVGYMGFSGIGKSHTPSIFQHHDSKKPEDGGSGINGANSGKTTSEILAELQKKQINVKDSVNPAATFTSGKSGTVGAFVIQNDSSNSVAMQGEIYDSDNNEIAVTPFIKPGQYSNTATLKKDVSSGTSKVTVYINYYTPDTKQHVGKAAYVIDMTVK